MLTLTSFERSKGGYSQQKQSMLAPHGPTTWAPRL
jgi:hypothetical protein